MRGLGYVSGVHDGVMLARRRLAWIQVGGGHARDPSLWMTSWRHAEAGMLDA